MQKTRTSGSEAESGDAPCTAAPTFGTPIADGTNGTRRQKALQLNGPRAGPVFKISRLNDPRTLLYGKRSTPRTPIYPWDDPKSRPQDGNILLNDPIIML